MIEQADQGDEERPPSCWNSSMRPICVTRSRSCKEQKVTVEEDYIVAKDKIIIKGAREHNLKNMDLEIPRDKLVVFTGLSGSGKVLAGVRHHLRRRTAPVCGEPFLLCPAVPGADGKAGCGLYRGAVPGDFHRPENHLQKPPFHCGHRHRDLRLPASARTPGSVFRTAPSAARRSSSRPWIRSWTRCWPCRRAPGSRCWPRWCAGARASTSRSLKRPGAVRLCPGAGGRQSLRPLGGDQAGKEQEAHHRDRGGPAGSQGGDPFPSGGFAGNCSWRLTGGLAVVDVIGGEDDLLFSQNYACPEHGVSIEELTPRMFSFNNPYGACPKCTGLGTFMKVDPDLVIPNKNLSIRAGGHQGQRLVLCRGRPSPRCTMKAWPSTTAFPWIPRSRSCPKKIVDILLYGTNGGENLKIRRESDMTVAAPTTPILRALSTIWSAASGRPAATGCREEIAGCMSARRLPRVPRRAPEAGGPGGDSRRASTSASSADMSVADALDFIERSGAHRTGAI